MNTLVGFSHTYWRVCSFYLYSHKTSLHMEEAEIWKNCVVMTDITTAMLLIITVLLIAIPRAKLLMIPLATGIAISSLEAGSLENTISLISLQVNVCLMSWTSRLHYHPFLSSKKYFQTCYRNNFVSHLKIIFLSSN